MIGSQDERSAAVKPEVRMVYRCDAGVMIVENLTDRTAALLWPNEQRLAGRMLAPGAQVVPWRQVMRLGVGAHPPGDARWPSLLAAAGASIETGGAGLPLADLSACDAWPEDGRQIAPIVEKWLAIKHPEALLEIGKKHDGTRPPKLLQFKPNVVAEFRPALPDEGSATKRACEWLSQHTGWKVSLRGPATQSDAPAPERLRIEDSVEQLQKLLLDVSSECRACNVPPASIQSVVKGTVRLWSLLQYGKERPPAPALNEFAAISARRRRRCAFCKDKKVSDEKGGCGGCGLFYAVWEDTSEDPERDN